MFSRRVPVTSRSRAVPGCRLRVVDSFGVSEVSHVLDVPRGACPVSRNPIDGTATITYKPVGASVEVVSLHAAMAWACGRNPGAPNSVEQLATWLATETATATAATVSVRLDLLVRPHQRLAVVAVA